MKKGASAFTRVFSFVTDLLIGHGVLFCLISVPGTESFFSKLDGLWKIILGQYHSTMYFAFNIWAFTVICRLYSTIILGQSLGQWLCGIRSRSLKSNEVLTNIYSAFRVLPEFLVVTVPISSIPVLFGAPSISELLSDTRLEAKRGSALYFKVLGIPILCLASFLSPILQDFTLFERFSVDFVTTGESSVASKLESREYASNRFRLVTNIPDKKFLLISNFETTQLSNKNKIEPFFIWVDKTTGVDAHFKAQGNVDLLSVLQKGMQSNPLFSFYYPDLHKLLTEYNIRKPKESRAFPVEVVTQIDGLIRESMRLSIYNLWAHIITKGPFIKGYAALKNEIFKLVDSGVTPKVSIIKAGGERFLHLEQKYSHNLSGGKNVLESYIPLGTQNSLIYQVYWNKGEKYPMAVNNFRNNFLANTKWNFESSGILPFPTSVSSMKPTQIADYLPSGNLQPWQRKIVEKYILKYVKDLGSQVIREKNGTLRELLLSAINSYHFVARVRNNMDPGYFSNSFVSEIKSLKWAIRSKNASHLESN